MSDIPMDVGHPATYMIAIIRTGGKQYIVKPGDKLKIEKLDKKEGEEFSFSDVLLVEKSNKIEIGAPLVKAATADGGVPQDAVKVRAKVLSHGKGDKIIVFKYKSKKRESRKIGHRQPYTEIEIIGIK
jgi:large subunit ribosomal protein L21